jgi:hypothetical protein
MAYMLLKYGAMGNLKKKRPRGKMVQSKRLAVMLQQAFE